VLSTLISTLSEAQQEPVVSTSLAGRRRLAWLIGGVILIFDQFTKYLVIVNFTPGQSIPALPPVMYFTYVQNTGAAFGFLKGQQTLFIVLSVLIIIWITRELLTKSMQSKIMLWGCSFVLGGAVGNLIDRLRFGYVVDFIDFRVWPVFNIADSAITVGIALLMAYTMVMMRRKT